MPYLRSIDVFNHPRQGDLKLDLSDGEGWRHLIITGPNGSGKTTILRAVAAEVDSCTGQNQGDAPRGWHIRHAQRWFGNRSPAEWMRMGGSDAAAALKVFATSKQFAVDLSSGPNGPSRLDSPDVAAMADAFREGTFVTAWLPDQRYVPQRDVVGPSSTRYKPSAAVSALRQGFHQYLVDQFVRAELNRRREPAVAEQIDGWLASLEASLAELFDVEGLKLAFGDDPYCVEFVEPSGLRYGFEQLAAGHASVLAILAEIILRVEGGTARLSQDDKRLSGVVIIDEIDLHLHPAMQEKVLPFLLRLFPRFQFIVATHSPAVICSVDGAWVFDLKTRQRVASEDLRGQQYGALMVDHFGLPSEVDLETTKKLNELRRLDAQDGRNSDDEARLAELLGELDDVSHPLVLEARLRRALRHEAARRA